MPSTSLPHDERWCWHNADIPAGMMQAYPLQQNMTALCEYSVLLLNALLHLQAELARCAECACFREEQNKEKLVENGYAISLLQLLSRHCSGSGSSSSSSAADSNGATSNGHASSNGDAPSAAGDAKVSEPFVAAACGVLRAVCT